MSPGLIAMQARLEARKAYNIAATLYGGADKKQALQEQANAARMAGEMGVLDAQDAQARYKTASNANLMSGGASLLNGSAMKTLFDRFGSISPDSAMSNATNYTSMPDMTQEQVADFPWME